MSIETPSRLGAVWYTWRIRSWHSALGKYVIDMQGYARRSHGAGAASLARPASAGVSLHVTVDSALNFL